MYDDHAPGDGSGIDVPLNMPLARKANRREPRAETVGPKFSQELEFLGALNLDRKRS
jgi:hypothetical protein